MNDLLPVRVTVQDVWDEIQLELPRATPILEAKRRALKLVHVTRPPEDYMVKYRGAQLLDESRTLGDAGIVPNAPLIVLPRRRRPVR